MPAPTKPTNQQTNDTPVTATGDEPDETQLGDESNTDDEPDASQQAGADRGEGNRRPKNKKPEGITAEVQAYLDSELRKARLKAQEDGKIKGREELQAELEDRNADDTQRLAKAQTKVGELQSELSLTKRMLAKLTTALKVGLPNPQVNFKRLIDTDDEEALEADAVELKESLGVQPNGNQQPVHTPRGPRGGSSTQQATRSEDEDANVQKVGAQATNPMYKSM
jgi:hypothetical protein